MLCCHLHATNTTLVLGLSFISRRSLEKAFFFFLEFLFASRFSWMFSKDLDSSLSCGSLIYVLILSLEKSRGKVELRCMQKT
jgi:hypothetical protein